MYKVTFRDTTGRNRTFTGLDRQQAAALATFARTLGEQSVVGLRVRQPGADRFGPTWEDVTATFAS